MASRKEYEMLFALNARMNGGFSGTFSKAQAEFSRLGKEIQALQKIQGNISSYQKQQGAIEATRSKLEICKSSTTYSKRRLARPLAPPPRWNGKRSSWSSASRIQRRRWTGRPKSSSLPR